MIIGLPDISPAPLVLRAKGADVLAAQMALEVLKRPGAAQHRIPPRELKTSSLEHAALAGALSEWLEGLNAQLSFLRLRLHVHSGAALGYEMRGNVTIFVGHASGEYIDSIWLLKRRWDALEARAPGLAASALDALEDARSCPIYTPRGGLWSCANIHWMGEADETFTLSEYCESETREEFDKLDPKRRQQLADEVGCPTLAWYQTRIPPHVLQPKPLSRTALQKLARRRGETGEIASAVLALRDAMRAGQRRSERFERVFANEDELEAVAVGAALRWNSADPTLAFYEDEMNHKSECSTALEPFYYWQTLHAGEVAAWMASLERRLPEIRAVENLIPHGRDEDPLMAEPIVSISAAERMEWVVRNAIMIYESRDRNSVYATVHDIRIDGNRPVLGAGRPATKESCGDLARALGASASLSGFTPANLLFLGGRCAIWWRPPGKGPVFFNCNRGPAGDQYYDEAGAKLLGRRSGVTPHPGLVFAVRGREWFVFAVKGAHRPEKRTPLYRAPYFNVWRQGKICTGTTPLPNRLSAEALDVYEQAFFGSNFTHANIKAPGKLVAYSGGPYAFWDAGLRGEWNRAGFPVRHLIDRKLTLEKLAGQLEKGKELDNDWA